MIASTTRRGGKKKPKYKRRWNHKPKELYPTLEQIASRYPGQPRRKLRHLAQHIQGAVQGLTEACRLPAHERRHVLRGVLGQLDYALALLEVVQRDLRAATEEKP